MVRGAVDDPASAAQKVRSGSPPVFTFTYTNRTVRRLAARSRPRQEDGRRHYPSSDRGGQLLLRGSPGTVRHGCANPGLRPDINIGDYKRRLPLRCSRCRLKLPAAGDRAPSALPLWSPQGQAVVHLEPLHAMAGLVRTLARFTDLTQAEQQAVQDLPARLRVVGPGGDIVPAGEAPAQCCLVLDG